MKTLIHYVGEQEPQFTDTLTNEAGEPLDLEDPSIDSVILHLREENEGTTFLDATLSIVPAGNGKVTYDWEAGDVGTERDTIGWETIMYANGRTQSTPPFRIRFIPAGSVDQVVEGWPQWITGDDIEACDSSAGEDADYESAALLASQLLYVASGRQFPGERSRTIRPAPRSCSHWASEAISGGWSGWGWVGVGGCGHRREIPLYGVPIREVTEILIDGDVLDPAAYRVDANRMLVRTDGFAWPLCQDLGLATTEPGTFSIEYSYGADPPPLGVKAATLLGAEIAKVCVGDGGTCEIPGNAVSVAREGITYQLAPRVDPATGQARLLTTPTGIDLVDQFLRLMNPSGRTRRPAFFSPDRPEHRRVS